MPPHTISPTPDHQGLGIMFSTLSPPPIEPAPPRFTGMVSQSTSGSPQRLPPPPQAQTQVQPQFRPQPSPTRLPPATRGQPLQQAGFSLRPTHTRQGSSSKGFASFSAMPPSPARPMGPRSAGVHSPKLGGSTACSESVHSHVQSAENEEQEEIREAEEETPKQHLRPLPTSPSRSGSVASRFTTSSKQSRKVRSSEMLRKYSKSGNTLEAGRTDKYLPLAGDDEQDDHHQHLPGGPSSIAVEASPAAPLPFPQRPSTRMTNVSEPASGASGHEHHRASPSRMSSHTQQTTFTEESGSSGHARRFPFPPTHPYRTATTYSDPTAGGPSLPGQNFQPMARSRSQPQQLFGVPDFEFDRTQPALCMPKPSSQPLTKRASDISSGVHSKNAVLLSAESGGMMLAFSPTGDGTFRAGELICGSGTDLLPFPASPHDGQMGPRHSTDAEDGLRSRPWSNSTMSEHMPKPTMLGHRGRSLSDGAQLLARQGTLLHPASSKQRASAELGVLLGAPKSRRLSRDKLLPPPPTEGDQNQSAWEKNNKVRLEASKKGKARVEVDVVLERECVVEGGDVRGRMEVRITGGKRGEGLRVGGGKVRVVGFEELSATSRHIFYHQPYTLPVFDPSIQHNLSSSLFASGPDSDGHRLAAEGTHSIPFRMRLPLGGGAKGTYTSPNGKGACVRYVVVGSIKIHIPSTGKRSIAHFYRSIVVLPYLNPSLVLAPSQEPVEGFVERGLGWSLTGEKGRVELRVSLGRRFWVSGQRLWCEVAISNNSNRKIKTLSLALLQTVQVFNPQPLLDTADLSTRLMNKRRSLPNCASTAGVPGTPDLDACQTTTQRKKISEEMIEADFTGSGAGRVTGKGWWTGVDSGESGHWDMSLQVPPGLLSVRRTRLIEVQYTLRVTVNGSIYVDIPVQLINFLSIDPPPMPRDGPGLLVPPISQTHAVLNNQPETTRVSQDGNAVYSQARPAAVRGNSDISLESRSGSGPARASSTTLHIDALLQAGRARAEAEAMGRLPPPGHSERARPFSLGSSYSASRPDASSVMGPMKSNPQLRPKGVRNQSYANSSRTDSHSVFSGEDLEEEEEDDEDDETDKAALAARRTMARQRSLAAITRAQDREQQKLDDMENARQGYVSPTAGSQPLEGYRPCDTPSEEVYEFVGDTPRVSLRGKAQPPSPDHSPVQQLRGLRITNSDPSVEDGSDDDEDEANTQENQALSASTHPHQADDKVEVEADEIEAGNETILADLVPEEREELQELISQHDHETGNHEYDYGEDVENESDQDDELVQHSHDGQQHDEADEEGKENDEVVPNPSSSRLPYLGDSIGLEVQQSVSHTRSAYENMSTPMSEQGSELGQVYEAVKRNVSVKVPSRLLPLPTATEHVATQHFPSTSAVSKIEGEPDNDGVSPLPRSSSVSHSILAGARRASQLSTTRRDSNASGRSSVVGSGPAGIPMARKSSALSNSGVEHGTAMRRDNSNPLLPSSPIRSEGKSTPPMPVAKVIQKKNSFTFATPRSPVKVKMPIPASPTSSAIPSSPSATKSSERLPRLLSPIQTISPLSLSRPPSLSPAPAGADMTRQPSINSRLRNEVLLPSDHSHSPDLSDDEHRPPGLAPSVISDSASSEDHALESPNAAQMTHIDIERSPASSKRALPFAPGSSNVYQPFPSDWAMSMGMAQHVDAHKSMIQDPCWSPGQQHLQTQVHYTNTPTYVQRAPHPTSSPKLVHSESMIATISHQRESSLPIPVEDISLHPSPNSSPSSCHSILPSVKNKIAQLESRDEALRKFSVSGASAPSSVAPSRQGSIIPPQMSPIQFESVSPHAMAKRRSYTAALAPKPTRFSSDSHYTSHSGSNAGEYGYGSQDYTEGGERRRLPHQDLHHHPIMEESQPSGHVPFIMNQRYIFRQPPPETQSSSGWLEGERPASYMTKKKGYVSGSVRSKISTHYTPSGSTQVSPQIPGIGMMSMNMAINHSSDEDEERLDPFGLGVRPRSIGMIPSSSSDSGASMRYPLQSYLGDLSERERDDDASDHHSHDHTREDGRRRDEMEANILKTKASGFWEGGDGVSFREYSHGDYTEEEAIGRFRGGRSARVEGSEDYTDESEGLL